MRSPSRFLVVLGTLVGVMSTTAAAPQSQDPPGPPGPVRGVQERRYAVAIERGSLHRQADVGSEEIREFRRGAVYEYLGPAADTFGRDRKSVV